MYHILKEDVCINTVHASQKIKKWSKPYTNTHTTLFYFLKNQEHLSTIFHMSVIHDEAALRSLLMKINRIPASFFLSRILKKSGLT